MCARLEEREPAPAKKPSVALAPDADRGRVRWNFTRAAWQLRYEDKDGKVARTLKGLAPAKVDARGAPHPPEEYERLRQAFLLMARQRWNELDQSGAERFTEAELAAV